MRKLHCIILIIAMLALPVMGGSQELGYGTHDILIDLETNQDMVYYIQLSRGDKLTVDLTAEGYPVDFYLTNRTAYEVYKASTTGNQNFDSFYFIQDYSRIEAGQISYTYDSLMDNEQAVLIDNTANIGSAPSGIVHVQGTIIVSRNVWTPINILVTVILAILIIAFMASFRHPRKKA